MIATYSPEDNKLRLRSERERLDTETYARVTDAGFIYAPKQGLFVAPMWTPEREDLLLELCESIEVEGSVLIERAEQRAAEFKERSEVRCRRLKRLEADLRKQQRMLKQAREMLQVWQQIASHRDQVIYVASLESVYISTAGVGQGESLWSALQSGKVQPAKARELAIAFYENNIRRAERWATHFESRISFERVRPDFV